MNITVNICGILRRISVNLIIRSSSLLPASPAAVPYMTAMIVDISVASRPTVMDILPPCQMTENKSRPRVSVPNIWLADGGWLI